MKVTERRVLPKQAKAVKKDVAVLQNRLANTTNVLNLGDTGKTVAALQRHLKAAGVYTGPANGTFDLATEAALRAFQTAKKLPATGALDKATFKALKTINVYVKAGFKTVAREGQRGSDIRAAEAKLAKLGFLKADKVDGLYDKATANAVARYRRADHQVSDKPKAIGEKFYSELSKASKGYEHDDRRRRDVTSKKGLKRHKQLDAMVGAAVKKAGKDGLGLGDKGRSVEWIEKHLEAAGYELGRQDRQFGTRTEAALKAFQRHAGLPQTGTVDGKTWSKLKGAWFGATSGTSPSQREGEKSGAVKRTEKLLKKLGYDSVGKVDGFFSAATEKAVKKFQRKHKLNVTGHVGGGTMNAIEKAWKKKNGGALASRILKLARSQLGVRESPMGSNRTKYSPFFGRPPEPWCADFVSWLYTKSGKKLNIPYTPTMLAWMKNNGTYNRYSPKPGQIIMFDWNPGSGVPAEHTGIVEKVYMRNGVKYVQTIEGNSGNMVRRRTYPVSSSQIAGFGGFK